MRYDETTDWDVDRLGTVGVFSPGIMRIPHLRSLLSCDRIVFRPDLRRRRVDCVVGWGRKGNTQGARAFAERSGCRYVVLEDGFLRSMDVGLTGEPPLSIVVDDIGVYYDATSASRLERMLAHEGDGDPIADPDLLARARQCMELVRRGRVSKYNAAPDLDLGPRDRARVLVVDQTARDLSLRFGGVHPGGFAAMVEAAVTEHPDAEILVKTHPDVATGRKVGHADKVAHARLRLLSEPIHPLSLLEQVDHVYVMTSLMGFEALLLGRPVTCFGMPFYAGWGLTDDRVAVPARRCRSRTVEELFAAAYLRYARYVDPENGQRCGIERVIEHLTLQRQMAAKNAGTICCIGFSFWKRRFVPAFLRSPSNQVLFARSARHAENLGLPPESRLLVWGSREGSEVRALAARRGFPVWRMEDGFLRSVGLGSDLVMPTSLVVDQLGIYYDPTRPSELECILQEGQFDRDELERAAALRRAIVEHGISKYNRVGRERPIGAARGDDREVVLAIGQVEDDASIQLGCPGIRRNAELIRVVRRSRPEAWIVFKPHPDVVRGNRAGAVRPEDALQWCDEIAEDASLPECLAAATEVHTLTSLVGFEALLRGLPVVVYGQPFYSGWGLTKDHHPHWRRTRRLSLDELVAGALIRYPRYVSRTTALFTTPEIALEQLRHARSREARSEALRSGWTRRQVRKAVNFVRGMIDAP